MDVSHVPRSITFQPTPIGQSRTHLLSLQSDIPVDFEYELEYEDSHPAFTITPMKGMHHLITLCTVHIHVHAHVQCIPHTYVHVYYWMIDLLVI